MTPPTAYQQWLQTGIDNHWCSEPVCYSHDSIELTDDEQRELAENDHDLDVICPAVVRLWGDSQ